MSDYDIDEVFGDGLSWEETRMRFIAAGLLITGIIVCAAPVRPDTPTNDIDGLIAQLGSARYGEREAAMRALDMQKREITMHQRLRAGEKLPDISGATAIVEAKLVKRPG